MKLDSFTRLATRDWPWPARLVGGVVTAWAALALHMQMERLWPGGARFALLYPTILMSCLILGRWGGLSCLFTGLAGLWIMMTAGKGDDLAMPSGQIAALCVYTGSGLLLVAVVESYRALTRQLVLERRQAAARKAEEDAKFVELFRHSPGLIAIFRGQDLIVEFASRGLEDLLGRDGFEGRSYRAVAPETAAAFFDLMAKVLGDGQTRTGLATPSPIRRRPEAPAEERYFDFVFHRIAAAANGEPRLFVQAVDVTEAVLARQESQKAERQLKAVLEEMPVGVVLVSVESQAVTLYNRAAVKIVGHEVLGRTPEDYGLYGALHPDGSPLAPEDYPAARALRGETVEKAQVLYRRPDGRVIQLVVDAKRVADGVGEPIVICAFTDVTLLKQALDTQSLLINELNHRVKNTLATVQALASQTFTPGVVTAEGRAAFEGRLQALSQAHDVLTDAEWRAASLLRLVAAAIAPFGAERFEVSGEDVELTPQKAVAVAMALHELATNAVKYGALSLAIGRVEILCDGPATRRRLVWRERGGPPVETPTRLGFGMKLLRRALAHDVDGGISVDFEPTGVVCTIDGL